MFENSILFLIPECNSHTFLLASLGSVRGGAHCEEGLPLALALHCGGFPQYREWSGHLASQIPIHLLPIPRPHTCTLRVHMAVSPGTWGVRGGRLADCSALPSLSALRFKPSFFCRMVTTSVSALSFNVIAGVVDVSSFTEDGPCLQVFAVGWPEIFFPCEGEHVTLPSQQPRSLSNDLLLPW